MTRKLTYEHVKSVFEEGGCVLLSETYDGNHKPLEYKCSCGNVSTICFSNFRIGQRCSNCGGGKRLDFNYVDEFFQSVGCVLLEAKYVNAHTKMNYRCKCGTTSVTTWNNFSKGKTCWECRKQKLRDCFKHDYEYVKNYFAEKNCVFLSDSYFNCRDKLKYQCSCGTIDEITFIDFLKDRRCRNCTHEKRCQPQYNLRGPLHPKWNPDREEIALRLKIAQKCSSALRNALKAIGKKKDKKSAELLGYTRKQLKEHIISQPNWRKLKNKKWEMDHIFPIAGFIRNSILDIKIINSLDNLQILTKSANVKKADKYDPIAFQKWLATKGIVKEHVNP